MNEDDGAIELRTSHVKEELTKWENELIKDILELLKLKCLCRIRGLGIDIQTQENKEFYNGGQGVIQEFYRHLAKLDYIFADIDCASKYLNYDELLAFKYLKNKFGKGVKDECN